MKKLTNKAARLAARNPKFSARLRDRAAGPAAAAAGKGAGESSALNMWALAALGLAGGAAAAVAPGRAERAAGQPAAAPGDGAPGTALEQAQAALPSAAESALSPALEALVEQLATEATALAVPGAGAAAAAEAAPGAQEPVTAGSPEPAAEAAMAEAAEIARAAEALAGAALPGEAVVLAQAGGVGAGTAAPAAAGAGAGAAAAGAAVAGATTALSLTALAAVGLTFAVVASGGSGDTPAQAADTTGPTATVALGKTALKAGETATVTITFSEVVKGFDSAQDVTVQSGTLSSMTSSDGGKTWTGTFTPSVNLEDATNVISLSSSYTDSAGNAGSAAQSENYAVDTQAPVVAQGNVSGIDVNSNDGTGNPSTVVITYDSDLDPAKLPQTTAFSIDVNAGGVLSTREVATVAIDGKVLTLTLAGPNIPLGATVTLSYADVAGDGAGTQDLAGNEAAAGTFIKIADGYVRGAKIYIDTNGNGEADPTAVGALAADFYAGETDALGNFFLPANAPKGTIIAVGGVNVDTGVANDVPLKAPAGSTTVNPLTTLVQAVLENNVGSGAAAQTPEAIQAATQAVATALGITGAGADLTRFDPVAAAETDPSAQKAAAKIATVFALAEGAGAGSGQTVLENLTTQVQAAIENGATVALDDASTLGAVLQGTNTTLEQQSKIADAAKAIAEAESLADITKAQSQFLDTVAPGSPKSLDLLAASDAGSSDADNLTNRTTVAVRVALQDYKADGTDAVAGDQVFLLLEGAKVGEARVLTAADIANGYVDIDAAGLQNGVNTLVARIVDQSGKASDGEVTPVLQISVDTAAPQGAVLGAVGGDDVLNASEQGSALAGTAEANARVTLTLGSATRTVTADASGNWSYALQGADITALGQGATQLVAVVTDVAGNASASVARAFVVDTVAPTATAALTAVVDNVEPNAGPLAAGATSNDQTLALSGTVGALGAGEQVVVYDGVTRLGVATVDAQAGTWAFLTPHLGNGSHALSARVEDAAGNAGAASAAFNVVVDTVVPAAVPQVAGFSVGAANGSALQGSLTNDATPRVNGTLQGALAEGQSVVVFDGSTRLGAATVAQDGATWHFDTAGLSDGAHSFSAVVESAAGVQGARGAAAALRVDTVAPAAPTLDLVAGNDVINASEQGAVITGTAEAGATVSLTLGANVRTVQAGTNGAWSYTLVAEDINSMGQGPETLSASARDAAGNDSTVSGTRQITIDTVAPTVAPTVSPVAVDDKINLTERGQAQTVQGPAGSVESGATVTVSIGTATYRIAANADGSWSHTLSDADYAALGQGSNLPIVVRSTDAAGNAGAAVTHRVEIDTVAPAMSPFTLDVASDSGTKGDGRSNDTTPTFTVTAEAGAKLAFQVGNGAFEDVADGIGQPQSVTLQALTQDGTYTITLRATDGVGNTTLRTGAYTLDTTPLAAATVGAVAGDNIVNAAEANAGVTVGGQASPYATIVLRNEAGAALGTAAIKANAAGAWTYTLTAAELQAMGQGGETLSVVTRDAADNDSAPVTRLVTIDTEAPATAPVISQVVDDVGGGSFTGALAANATTNDQTLTLTGTASGTAAGDRVVVFDGATRLGEASVEGGSWTFTTPNLSNAAHSLTARVVDAAGNQGPASTAFAVTVNVTPPAASAAVTGFRVGETNATALQGAVTNDTSPAVAGTVTGTLAQGDVVVVYDGATRLGAATVDGANWSYAATGLTAGAHSFSAVVESSAGTQGTRSTALALTVDTTPPSAPVINTVAGDNVINVLEQGAAITGTAEAGARVALTLGSVGQVPNIQTVTAGANGAWSYTLKAADISALGQDLVTLTAVATDAAGNTGAPGTRSVTIDTVAPGAPVVDMVADDGIINAAERAAGVSITGSTDAGAGSRVTVTVAGNSYRVTADDKGQWFYRLTDADFNALGQGAGKTIVAAATDAVGNTGAPATGNSFTIDTVAPTLSPVALLAASDSGAKGDGISNVATPSFGFTAEAGVTFTGRVGDGAFQPLTAAQEGNGLKVTLPAGALAEGANTITLRATDAAGNFVERSGSYFLDTSAPALAIASDETAPVANIDGGGIVYTFTFSQPVTGFSADDVVVTGGSKGIFSGVSPTVYTLVVHPDAGMEGELGVSVAADAARDVAGNASTAQQAAPQAYDFRAPTVTITDNQSGATNGDITYTFTFSEPVSDFTAGDVTVSGGSPGAFTPSAVPAEAGRVYTLVVTPTPGIEGNVTVGVAAAVATDAVGNPSVAATPNVQAVDTRGPVFQSGATATFAESGTGDAYAANASDASGPVQYSLTGGADQGLFTIDGATGALRFKAAPNFEAPADAGANNVYDVQVTAADSFGQTSVRDVAVTVTNVNEAPTATTIAPKIVALNVAQTGSISVASAFADPDAGDALSFSAAGLPAGLSLTSGGQLTGTATALTTQPATVSVTATDKAGLTATQSFTLSVVEAPAVSSLTASVPAGKQGTVVVFTMKLSEAVTVTGQPVLTLEVDGSPLTAAYDAVNSTPADASGGVLKFTANIAGGNDPQVQVVSLTGATIVGTVTDQDLTSPVGFPVDQFQVDNTAPSFQDGPTVTRNFAENGTGAVHGALVTDATAVSYALGGADAGKFDIDANGAITFKQGQTPDSEQPASAAQSNTYTVEVTATDAVGLTAKQTVTVNVTNVNDNPVVLTDVNNSANSVAENAAAGTTVGVTASATDADTGATIAGYSLDGSAGGRFAINPATGVVTVASPLDHETAASHTITVRATSSDGSFKTEDITIAVTDVNEAPTVGTVTAPPVSVGVAYQFNAGARFADVDKGDALTFSATGLPAGLQIDPTTGVISGTVAAESVASVSVTATDKANASVTVQFSLTVQEGITFTFEGETFIVPTAPLGDETFFVASATPTGENSGLFRLETMSDTYDYELWVAVEDGQVVAHKAFSTDAGFMQRSLGSPDGSVYFQVINATLQRAGGNITGVTQAGTGPATTLYAVDPASAVSMLTAAANTDTLVGLPGVSKVRDFTRAELGITSEQTQADLIALLDGYVGAATWNIAGASSAYVSFVVNPLEDDPGLSFLGRIDSQGNVPGGAPKALNARVDYAFPVAGTGLFVSTGATATTGEAAYHFNPVTGVVSQIGTTLFDNLAASGTEAGVVLPPDVTFLSGSENPDRTPVNDVLGSSAASSTQRQWLAGGEGNDTLQGGAGDDLLYGGAGGDSLVAGDGNDVLSGMGGDDRLQGQGGADTLYGGGGTDRIQFFGAGAMAGDVVTGSGTIWDGKAETILAGADQTTDDRIQLLNSGTYDFKTAASISFIDRVDVVSGISGATEGDFILILTPQMATTANQNRNSGYGDIRVVGYDNALGSNSQNAPTTANVKVDASSFTAKEFLVVLGQDGSGVTDPATAFGGMRGNDTLLGGAGGDYLFSGAGNDSIVSGGGVDTISGGAGNDFIDAGAGNDTVLFTGNHADYTITLEADGSVTVQDSVAGRDGTDTLKGVESLQFADKTVEAPRLSAVVTVAYAQTVNLDSLIEATLFGDGDLVQGGAQAFTVKSDDGLIEARFTGTGFAWEEVTDSEGTYFEPTGGTIIGIDFYTVSGSTASLAVSTNGFDVSLVALSDALNLAFDTQDLSAYEAILAAYRYDVTGSSGNDTLGGNVGDDTVKGADGSDTLEGSPGNDTLDGGNPVTSGGSDYADYRDAPEAVIVNLQAGTAATGAWGNDTLISIEGVLGSAFNDSLVGSDNTAIESEVFVGGLRNDTIDGGAGFDIAHYDWGNTQAVSVNLFTGIATGAGIGTDSLIRIEGVIGSIEADTLTGSSGDDWFRPQRGNDTVDGGAGNDRVVYDRASGAVTVDLSGATGTSSGADGNDTLLNIENLRGSAYGDTLTGSAVGNDIQGRDGNDTIYGLDGNDSLNGENGNDSLLGGNGADTLIGGAGNDTLDGGAQLYLEDNANLGNEFDVAVYNGATAGLVISLGADGTQGFARSRADSINAGVGTDTLIDIEYVVASNFDDVINGSDRALVEIFRGNRGDDTIHGGSGTGTDLGLNLVDYRDANGAVTVNLGIGTVSGADGNDVLLGIFHGAVGSSHNDTLIGSDRDDFLQGRTGDDSINGGAGRDRVAYNGASGGVTVNLATGTSSGADGNDVLANIEDVRGSEFDDTLIGNSEANDLQGRAGNDTIQGGDGNDTIHGGKGNDVIDGGAGQDLARFSGLFERYAVSVQNGVVTITDSATDGDGVDTVSNVERFKFTDGVYKLNTGGTGLVVDAVEITSALDGVNNFDVTSAIVLQAAEPVTAVAGKKIRIMNDGGAGFRGENGDNDQEIDVGSAAVTVQGNLIIIRPPFDLDLANAYHVEVDAGAFSAGGVGNAAVSDPDAINFSTVVPGNGLLGVGAAAHSQAMDVSTGALQSSSKWLDIEGVGSPSSSAGAVLDLVAADIALVFKDYDPAPASAADAFDGIGAPDFYVAATNFGTKDLLYIDSQVNSAPNDLSISSFGETASAPPDASLSFGTGTGGLGGVVEFPSPDSFASVEVLLALMPGEHPPIISG